MNIKTYLSIKFIVYIFFIILVGYIINLISTENKDLREQKEILLSQKKQYEKIILLSNENPKEKKFLFDLIERDNVNLKEIKNSNNLDTSTLLKILILLIGIWFYIFNILDKKIRKLESQESEFKKQQML